MGEGNLDGLSFDGHLTAVALLSLGLTVSVTFDCAGGDACLGEDDMDDLPRTQGQQPRRDAVIGEEVVRQHVGMQRPRVLIVLLASFF